MELKAAKCPGCGGTLQLDPSLEKGKCPYCGNEIIVAEAIQKFAGEVDGIATVKNSLVRASQLLENNDFDGAMRIYKRILESSPTHYEAWWGLFNCELVIAHYYLDKDGKDHYNVTRYLDSLRSAVNSSGHRAVEYAPTDLKESMTARVAEIEAEISNTEVPKLVKTGACYIATAVYGSYEAPEVLRLRKYRDHVLLQTALGRSFVNVYYYLSPPIADWLRNATPVNRAVRSILDRFVAGVSRHHDL